MNRRWRRKHMREPSEMNITAFMNLMVILVPFLLITAVFSRMTILHLDLPENAANAAAQKPPTWQLELIVRSDGIELSEGGASNWVFGNKDGKYDLEKVSSTLQDIKSQFPDKTAITLLVEPDIAYNTLIQVMDTVRVISVGAEGHQSRAELFPDVAIGDAPPADAIGSKG